jgi:phosphatidylserine decarboxylase
MRDKFSIAYYDRASGIVMAERIYGGTFLYWSYNTGFGRLVTKLIFSQRFISQLYGWLHKQPLSRWKIGSFVQKMKINVDELVQPLGEYRSFNDFFVREIDLSKRPINQNPHVCIAPVDGKVFAYSSVDPDMAFRIKRSVFKLRSFLNDEGLVKKFSDGSMVISRLCLTDYHHFHFPDSGTPCNLVSIQGRYYAAGPYDFCFFLPFYGENYRMLTLLDSDHFHQIAMVEIGAFTVGSIQQRYQSGVHVAKGAHKGFFEVGGSTVVLLFQKGAIEIDKDLLARTKDEMETYVRLGDSIGRTPGLSIKHRKLV